MLRFLYVAVLQRIDQQLHHLAQVGVARVQAQTIEFVRRAHGQLYVSLWLVHHGLHPVVAFVLREHLGDLHEQRLFAQSPEHPVIIGPHLGVAFFHRHRAITVPFFRPVRSGNVITS